MSFRRRDSIRKIAVLGAGTMGSGIAAHFVNLGFQVTLFDLTPEAVAEGIARARQARPPRFAIPEKVQQIWTASVISELELAAEADWVIEAVSEDLAIKRTLFERLDGILPEDVHITTNTSGLQLNLLREGRSESFRKRFLGTHFFNPPRYLKLLELIPTPETDPEVVAELTAFLEERAGRRVVPAKDTPGFIANRFGMWSMFHAIHTAEKLGLTVEQVDAITGPFLGRPRSGSFRLADVVGIDVMKAIADNQIERCPHDPFTDTLRPPASLAALLERGWIGEKGGQGYYRREGKEYLALDLGTLSYRDRHEAELPLLTELARAPLADRLTGALASRCEVGEYLRNHLLPTLAYAESIKEEISHSVLDFDRVMQWGFGWEAGPFQLLDFVRADAPTPYYTPSGFRSHAGEAVPLPDEPAYSPLESFTVVRGVATETLALRDLGDGVTAVSFRTKMGTINPTLIAELRALLDGGLDRFILASGPRAFSVGFDLSWFLAKIDAGELAEVDSQLIALQELGELLETRQCVAAVQGHCLGGGFEIALGCPVIVAQFESHLGLPEAKVGLLPAGRGSSLLRVYAQSSAKRACEVAMVLTEGRTASNTEEAKSLGYLRPSDVVEPHPDRVLSTAKRRLLEGVAPVPHRWEPIAGPLSGLIDRGLSEGVKAGTFTGHDNHIGEHLRTIFARSSGFQDALNKERSCFLELCGRALSVARIRHMLEQGKPLRN